MKKLKTIFTVIGLNIVVWGLLIAGCVFAFNYYHTELRIDIGGWGGAVYLEDYQDYFLRTETVFRRTIVGTRAERRIIYFRPGQRRLMVARIRADIITGLNMLVEEHNDVFYQHTVSDDLRQVRIYSTPNTIQNFGNTNPGVLTRLRSLMGLYHMIKNGHSGATHSTFRDGVIEWIMD